MTAHTVGGCRGRGRVYFDLCAVVVAVGIEVARMTGGAGTAIAVVGSGVTIAVYAIDQRTVCAGVTGEAGVFMGNADCITGVAVDAESCVGHGC